MESTRREFLASSVGGAALLATAMTMPGFLTRSARAAAGKPGDRALVVVQLSGGNDGLNTVVPFEDDLYHNARPTLGLREGVHRLEDGLALHPDMVGLKRLFDDGRLAVINNVGYPNPDRSHFRSMDVWHSANCDGHGQTGWLGRLADEKMQPGTPPMAVQVDDAEVPLALRGERFTAPSFSDISSLHLHADSQELRARIGAERAGATEDLRFVQRVAVESCEHAARIRSAAQAGPAGAAYPALGLAHRLSQIAKLIGAGFGARVYYTSIGGFDTHARQALAHGPLLRELSDSIEAFQRDIRARGLSDRVLLMTFSEFGRRVKENGSRGTDHGAAAPMFFVGDGVLPGVHGGRPDLSDLTDGDVRHAVDFRRVYATALSGWLDVDAQPVVGDFASLKVLA